MKRTFLSSLVLGPALLLGALLLPATAAAVGPITPSSACTAVGTAVTCNLWAKVQTGGPALPGTTVTKWWGFSDSATGIPTLPGPVLVVNQGDTVTVNLTNNLAVTTSILFDGQPVIPDTTGVGAGGTKSYAFNASAPGTYLYEAGLIPGTQYQVAMGLYGVLVVRPSGAPGQAYGASTAFDDEALVVLGEIDPVLNGSANPVAFDLRNFAPKFQLINGQAYSSAAPSIATTGGNKLLLRYANAGIGHHSMGVLGLRQSVLAADGSPLQYPRNMAAETVAPGQTADVLVSVPSSTAVSTKYALYDAALLLNNNGGQPFGGMLAFIDAAASGTSTGDTVGPITSGVTLDIGTGALAASVTDASAGGSGVSAAEYYVDTTTGTGTAMAGSFGSDPAAVTATVSLGALTSGSHTIYVRGQDGVTPTGNWGAFSSVTFTLDTTGPTTSGLVLSPNPSDGSVPVTLSGSASDTATGNANVVAAEYTIDGGPAVPMTLNTSAPTVGLTATIPAGLAAGAHPVTVRSQDAALNWGATAAITLNVVTATGPTTSAVSANPAANNGTYGQSSSNLSVRVRATFTDPVATITAGEGFIDTVGAPGTGFPFTPTDGVFNALGEAGYADIPLTTINSLSVGNHTIAVRGRNAAGTWGTTVSITYLIDKTAPTFTGISLAPSPTLGAPNVTLTVNGATDPLVGGLASGVAGGAYWIDTAAPAPGGGTAFTGMTASIPTAGLSTGNHTIGARVRDAAGNWSTANFSATVTVIPDLIFVNGFDTGGGNWGWTSRSTSTTARLNVTTSPALVGARSLRAQGNNTNYVQYNFGTGANPASGTYDARFVFNPNNNASSGQDILRAAAGTSNASFNSPLFRVRYRRSGAQPQVQLQVGATANPTWVNITNNASNVIEVVWQSGTTLELYVNGTLAQTLTASAGSVSAVRLGSVSSGGSSTDLYFDAFASKRSVSPIYGP